MSINEAEFVHLLNEADALIENFRYTHDINTLTNKRCGCEFCGWADLFRLKKEELYKVKIWKK